MDDGVAVMPQIDHVISDDLGGKCDSMDFIDSQRCFFFPSNSTCLVTSERASGTKRRETATLLSGCRAVMRQPQREGERWLLIWELKAELSWSETAVKVGSRAPFPRQPARTH